MSPRPPQGSVAANQNAYIPQNVQQAMSRQLQQAVPAHLKQYVGANPPAYVPPRVQAELASHMEKALPSHLQGYAGAYVQQNLVDAPAAARRTTVLDAPDPASKVRPPVMNRRNLSHTSAVGGSQADAMQLLGLYSEDRPTAPSQPAVPTGQPQAYQQPSPSYPATAQPMQNTGPAVDSVDPNAHYDFILNPQQPQKPANGGFAGPGGGSMFKRIAVVGVAGILLIIIIVVASSLLGGSDNVTTALTTVAQEQTELLRITTQVSANTSTPKIIQLANATNISLISAQQQLTSYMQQSKRKLNPKLLGLKHSAQDDTAIANAITTSNFDVVFTGILQNDLSDYAQSIKTAYNANPGPKGKALLQKQYNGAELLLQQSKE